jgi:hypothetical protein
LKPEVIPARPDIMICLFRDIFIDCFIPLPMRYGFLGGGNHIVVQIEFPFGKGQVQHKQQVGMPIRFLCSTIVHMLQNEAIMLWVILPIRLDHVPRSSQSFPSKLSCKNRRKQQVLRFQFPKGVNGINNEI